MYTWETPDWQERVKDAYERAVRESDGYRTV
jgi:hypothetical protein